MELLAPLPESNVMPVVPLSPSAPFPTGGEDNAQTDFRCTTTAFPSLRPEIVAPCDTAKPVGNTPPVERAAQPSFAAVRAQVEPLARLGASAAFVLCVAGFTVLATVLRHHFGFPLDDSWIHQTVARNLVEYGVLGYLPGIRSSGSSSLLWTLVLASQYRFLPWLPPVLFSALVNGLLLGLIGAGLKRMTVRDGLSRTDSWIFALAPALNGNFLWLGLLGMEHVLFVTLSVAAICLWFRQRRSHPRVTATGTVLLVGLLALTRPEGLFLALVLVSLRARAGRSVPQCAGLLLGTAMATAISLRVNWLSSHTLLPLTMKGRAWLYFGSQPMRLSAHVAFLRDWPLELLATWTFPGPSAGSPARNLGLVLLALLSVGLLLVGIKLLLHRQRNRTGALLLWMLFLTMLYTLVLPASGHGGRYQPLQVLLVLPLLWIALKRGIQWVAGRCGEPARVGWKFANGVVALLIGGSTAVSYAHWYPLASDGIDQIQEEHGAMGDWVQRNLPPGAITGQHIAVFDIGRIGYGLHGSLVDLGGLTDRFYLPYLFGGHVPEYLRQHRVQYVVLPTSPGQASPFQHTLLTPGHTAFVLKPLKTICFPLDRAVMVMKGTGAALPCQTAYALDFPQGFPP